MTKNRQWEAFKFLVECQIVGIIIGYFGWRQIPQTWEICCIHDFYTWLRAYAPYGMVLLGAALMLFGMWIGLMAYYGYDFE